MLSAGRRDLSWESFKNVLSTHYYSGTDESLGLVSVSVDFMVSVSDSVSI